MLARWFASEKARKRWNLGFTVFVALTVVILLVAFVVVTTKLVPIWVTDWQGVHGNYPTGHLTYVVPDKWDTTTLTGLKSPGDEVWWSVFDDQVTTVSPTYSACFDATECAKNPPVGARVALESAAGHGQTTIEGWYQNWAEVTAHSLGPDVVLPLADYTRVSLGGQTALCAANQEGSQMLPPHAPPSRHFATVFAGYTPSYVGQAVVMCFALWQGRVYHMEVTVELRTATQNSDLRDAARMIESLRFT
jgi:hypothetical protein